MYIETKVVNKKTVNEILKLRPKLIEEMYVQVCSGTQNLYWLKRNVLSCMQSLLEIDFLDYTP